MCKIVSLCSIEYVIILWLHMCLIRFAHFVFLNTFSCILTLFAMCLISLTLLPHIALNSIIIFNFSLSFSSILLDIIYLLNTLPCHICQPLLNNDEVLFRSQFFIGQFPYMAPLSIYLFVYWLTHSRRIYQGFKENDLNLNWMKEESRMRESFFQQPTRRREQENNKKKVFI